jgi:Ca-activated chloride channel family protein
MPVLYFELTPLPDSVIPDDAKEDIQGPVSLDPSDEEDHQQLSVNKYAANNIVLLLDVSLSMKKNHKLDSLKSSIVSLVKVLREIDHVSLISYASKAEVLLESVPGNRKNRIERHVDQLEPNGITNGVAGLQAAYEIARNNFTDNGNNQIIIATDGQFTGRTYKEGDLKNMVDKYRQNEIIISILGLGVQKDVIALMQELAEIGGGKFIDVSEGDQAQSILIEEIKDRSRISKTHH